MLAALLLAWAWLPAARAAGPLLWVTPLAQGAAALSSDGTVTLLEDDGSVTPLAHGVRGDSLRRCGDALLAVDADGNLRSLTGDARGPAVSPHSRPACLQGGTVAAVSSDARSVLLLSPNLQVIARQALDALPDGDPTPVGDAIALLSEPTQRYRHGVLGDEIEAGAVTLLSQRDLHAVAAYRLAAPAVIEQRRVAAFPAAGRDGMLITRSTPERGAGVVALALTDAGLTVTATAQPIGTGERWLNLFATDGAHAYAVRTPHLGGPLERYTFVGGALQVSRFALDVTNHVLGSRNLDLGALLPPRGGATGATGGVDVLALPTPDLRSVQLVACTLTGCEPELELSLHAPLSSNLAARWRGARLVLYAGENDGNLQTFTLDASLWTPSSAPMPMR
ncbi:MAG TPA: hypothetical protein VKA00_00970 [Trueperaceae bacterium]|nr:hypothetical protein [Trueperaceae bacterium]